MKTTPHESCQAETFELPAPLTFQQVFQSTPFWLGGGAGYMPQVLRELRSTSHKHSYLLSLSQRCLVLSVAVGVAPFFDSRSQRVNPIIEHAFNAGIGPGLIYSSPEKGYVVSEYLEGCSWTQADFLNLDNIERIALLLKQLHALPQEGPVFLAGNTEQRYWTEIRREHMPIPKRLHGLQLRMQKVLGYAQYTYRDKAACHNRLHVTHVLETEQGLRLVGWEAAAINDPYYDLAVIAHCYQFSETQVDQLLFHYVGKVGFDEREHFDYSYAVYIYLEALRCRVEAGHGMTVDQEEKIEAHIDTLLVILHRLAI